MSGNSEQPPFIWIAFLWILALSGWFAPSAFASVLSRDGEVARITKAFETSRNEGTWRSPWIALPDHPTGGGASLPCQNLSLAYRVDLALDDGNLASGNLQLNATGLLWMPAP